MYFQNFASNQKNVIVTVDSKGLLTRMSASLKKNVHLKKNMIMIMESGLIKFHADAIVELKFS